MSAQKQTLDLIAIPIAVICLAVAAQLMIKLPDDISVVPITGQSLAILLIIEMMDWKKATASVLLYLFLGGIGLPFFADFSGGWVVLSGPAKGYFFGFFISASVIGYWSDKASNDLFPTSGRLFTASLLILIFGWVGLMDLLSPGEAFTKGVLPYLPGAAVKFALALIIIGLFRRFMGLMGKVDTN